LSAPIRDFRTKANAAIEDVRLQNALEGATGRFRIHREHALDELPDVERLRAQLKLIRSSTLACLSEHLETFEREAKRAGAHVHWARDASGACEIVVNIAKSHQINLVTKSKSMTTEEIHLNQVLESEGIASVETDLGEWILQLAGEPPSHIIAPAIHKTKEQVAALFGRETGQVMSADIDYLTAEARRMLREKFLVSGMGISGGNIGVAETGSIVLVTNEGNGRMVTSLPKVHVALIGIEKIAPTWDDAAVWLALLARSATGQPLSAYTSIITGPSKYLDPDGPEEVHIILLDNRRGDLIGTKYEEILQCIRCGACLNVCPVYREAGGHAYNSPYTGPIGAVITPLLFGQEKYQALPHASTLCGACLDVCPVNIDLPRMLLDLRVDDVQKKMLPWAERSIERSTASILNHKTVMHITRKILWLFQKFLMRNKGTKLPFISTFTGKRNLPALAKYSFREAWKKDHLEGGTKI
jgi:L-lactate dehydrogenase complex protein LldF